MTQKYDLSFQLFNTLWIPLELSMAYPQHFNMSHQLQKYHFAHLTAAPIPLQLPPPN